MEVCNLVKISDPAELSTVRPLFAARGADLKAYEEKQEVEMCNLQAYVSAIHE